MKVIFFVCGVQLQFVWLHPSGRKWDGEMIYEFQATFSVLEPAGGAGSPQAAESG